MTKTPEQIVALVREAGVIGAAGTGFPTHAKLSTRAETVIVNGCECEPLLLTDKAVLKNHSEDVLQGLRLAMLAVGASEGVIAINRENQDAIEAMRAAIDSQREQARGGNISIHLMGNYYPAGDEFNTVYDVTGKVIPEGGSPRDVQVLVINVSTAKQIYQAVNGVSVTERIVTIAGAVRDPKVVCVPIGTRYSDLITMAGGFAGDPGSRAGLRIATWINPSRTSAKLNPTQKVSDTWFTVLEGGPMMGTVVTDLNAGISKATTAITVLPTDHYVIRMKTKPVEEITRQSRGVNSQRSETTELCPRHLLGHSLQPHEAMTSLDYSRAEPSASVTTAFLCSGCGVCELIGDEASFSSPKKIYGEFKARLLKAGIRNPHHREIARVHSQYENRKLGLPTLIKKLGIGEYVVKPAFLRDKPVVSLVRVPTTRHVGEPAHAQVRLDQEVRRGDLIAASPDDDLGTRYHAPIHGRVTEIHEHFIEITGEVT